MKDLLRSRLIAIGAALLLVSAFSFSFLLRGSMATASPSTQHFAAHGGLDCNNHSPTGQTTFRTFDICSDPRGPNNTRFEDNGHYVGHDEPATQFYSQVPGSGNNVQYMLTLPRERPLPAGQTFENTIAFWLSMALCDPGSFPQAPCKPDTDQNPNTAGSAFLEMQFYPPGFAPFISQISCDKIHWCASLHINSLECTAGFVTCNNNCLETTNFAFIQMDGIPTGPAGPDVQTAATSTPNAETLLMNQGDRLRVTISDTPGDVTGGVTTRIDDLSSGKSGFMIASAANQFQSLNINDCSGTDFSFHPEFSTAKFGNFVPWAALQANIGFSVEIGHFEVGLNGDGGDADDNFCFPTSPESILAGCVGSDLDFDGTSYQTDWPDGTRNNATSIRISSPRGAAMGSHNYNVRFPILQWETDLLASENSCNPDGSGCTVPPAGAAFYPFFSQSGGDRDADAVANGGFFDRGCAFEFGNLTRGVSDFGKDAQYGTPNLPWFFGTASSGPVTNTCTDD